RSEWEAPIPALAGLLSIHAESKTAPPQQRDVTADAGGELEVSFDFTPAPPPKEPPTLVDVPAPTPTPAPQPGLPADIPPEPIPTRHVVDRTLPNVLLGVGGAGLVTFVIFGALNESTFHDLEMSCPKNQCPPNMSDDIKKGRTQQAVANVGL